MLWCKFFFNDILWRALKDNAWKVEEFIVKTVTDEAYLRKKEIIKKCLEKFRNKGLEKTSVRDLCQFVGINSASMYYYFDSKDNVIFECVSLKQKDFNSE